jgi:hypothetical protein
MGPSRRVSINRAPFEYYPTPPEATRAFLSAEQFDGDIWEPACGQGAISKVLIDHGYHVVSSDLADYCYGKPGVDFLETKFPRAKHIVTNPPYGRGLGDRFLRKALELNYATGGKVAMLLKGTSNNSESYGFIRNQPVVIHPIVPEARATRRG